MDEVTCHDPIFIFLFLSLLEVYVTKVAPTAGAGWCFPRKNPLRDTFCDFQRVFPMETQKVFLKEKSKKHIMCFFQVSHR